MRIQFIFAIVSLLCIVQASFADFINIVNPSFEDISGETPFNEFTFGPLNGWQLYDPGANPNQLGQLLGIRLVNLNQVDPLFPNSDLEVDFDHVRLSAVSAVPEPNSLLMLSVAALGFAIRRIGKKSGRPQLLGQLTQYRSSVSIVGSQAIKSWMTLPWTSVRR